MNQIGRNVTLSDDTILGQDVTLGNNVSVYPGVRIGDGCRILDGVVLGRPPLSAGNNTRPLPDAAPLVIGPHSIIGANAVLYCGSTLGPRVLVGDLATIREGCQLAEHAVIGHGSTLYFETHLGERSRISAGCVLGQMVVEADVFMGPGINIFTDGKVFLTRFGMAEMDAGGPLVRRFAVIGAGATLGAKVEIGMGAIVAPAAMVTRDVPPWHVVAGIPARVLRPVDDADRDQILSHFGLQPLRKAG